MPKSLPLEQLKECIGRDLGCSDWMRIDQSRIDAFAEVTEDRQFIHVDPEKAAPVFGATIAHGFLILSLVTHLTEDLCVVPAGMTMGINYGFDRVRFLQPVKVGSEVRARLKLLGVTDKKPGKVLLRSAITVEIRDDPRPALAAEWLTLVITG